MKFLIPIFLFSFAYAREIDSDTLNSIYIEAILFILVVFVLSVFSIIVSKRNAKQYEIDNPLEDRRAARREEELRKKLDDLPLKKDENKLDKLNELSEMLKNGIINEEEFKILKKELFD